MRSKRAGILIGRILLVLGITLLLAVIAVTGILWVILRGPSRNAQELLTRSMKETSAVGFIPELFLSKERVAEIMREKDEPEQEARPVDVSLVTVRAVRGDSAPDEVPVALESGEAGEPEYFSSDGITLVPITGASYQGMLMIVDDPFRVFVGTPDHFGTVGLTLRQMVKKYDAVAGINAGGFYDPGGSGNGGTPEGIVIADGKLTWGNAGTNSSVIGFDSDGVLHVGMMSGREAQNRNIQWACSFGPALVVNGEAVSSNQISTSGVNPRTAIGQRADGAVLLLVVDGRQITSMGATLEDLIAILLEHGAVNAANLDGGSSTQMIYDGETLNKNASVIGERPLPTTFLVRR